MGNDQAALSLVQDHKRRAQQCQAPVPTMHTSHHLLLLCAALSPISAHEYYPDQCPVIPAMENFDWAQFATGQWFITNKFATRSTCLTYEFTTDELGFKEITQRRQLPHSEKIGLDHEYKYTGKLYAANEANPARMNVRFPLNPIGAASFVVMDTDYSTYGLICTCQDIDLLFAKAHRLSCSILQRAAEEDPEITSRLKDQVDEKLNNSAHDFDPIKQTDCEHDREKTWVIDPSKILGGAAGGSSVRAVVDAISNEFDFKTAEQIKEEASALLRR